MLVLKRRGDTGGVGHLAFAPGGRLVTADTRWRLNGWTAAGEHVWTRVGPHRAEGLTVTSDGRTVFATGGQLVILDAADGSERPHPSEDRCSAAATGPGGQVVLAWAVYSNGWHGVLVGGNGRADEPWRLDVRTPAGALAFLPGGDRFAEAAGGHYEQARGSAVTVRDGATGAVVRSVGRVPKTVEQLTAGGDWLAARAGTDVFVWHLADPDRPVVRLTTGSRRPFSAVAFHPSGEHLLATSHDGSARVYRAGSWGVARTFDWQIGRLRSVAASPDGALCAAGGDGGRVVLWDFDV